MREHAIKWTTILCVATAVLAIWLVAAVAVAFADQYYDTNKIYTEGIYVSDNLYMEPCFEHFKNNGELYEAIKIDGAVPEGTKYALHIQTKGESEDVEVSTSIPTLTGPGVYRIDVQMPGQSPVTFQAEIVLEGLQPCAQISQKDSTSKSGLMGFESIVPVSKASRPTYNIRRGESAGPIPVYHESDIAMRKFSQPDQFHSYIRELETIRAHTILLDISAGPFAPLERIKIGTQVYNDSFRFASHEEMKVNRETFGD